LLSFETASSSWHPSGVVQRCQFFNQSPSPYTLLILVSKLSAIRALLGRFSVIGFQTVIQEASALDFEVVYIVESIIVSYLLTLYQNKRELAYYVTIIIWILSSFGR
jgi:hypothetical protein